MAALAPGNKVGSEICDALGLKHCKVLDIHIAYNEIVTVTAKFYPEIDGVKQFPAIFKKYELVEIPEEKKEVE
jgi:hypothetical protein